MHYYQLHSSRLYLMKSEVTVKGSLKIRNIKNTYFQCIQENKMLEKAKIFSYQVKKNKYLEEKQLHFQDQYINFSLFTVKKKKQLIYLMVVCVCVCVCAHVICCVQLFATAWTLALQVPLPMKISSKNTGAVCHFLLQGIFLTQGLNRVSCVGRWILYHCTTWVNGKKSRVYYVGKQNQSRRPCNPWFISEFSEGKMFLVFCFLDCDM